MSNSNVSGDVRIAAGQSVKEKKYWLEKLSGEIAANGFPTDSLSPKKTGSECGTIEFTFDSELFSKLNALSKGSDYTLFIILVAQVTLLLNKYTGNNDIIVGAPIDKQEAEGEFINTVLAYRNRIEDHMTFKDLLIASRKTIIEGTEHQNYPLKSLLYDLGLDDSGDQFPLFDVTVLLENIQDYEYIRHIHTGTVFSFLRSHDNVRLHLNYDASLYKAETAQRIGNHLTTLLNKTLLNLYTPLSDIELITSEEKEQLITHYNDTATEYPKDQTIHKLFSRQAKATPDAVALSFAEDVSDIYEELKRDKINPESMERLGTTCFHTNKFIFKRYLNQFDPKNPFIFLKTQRHDIVVSNENVNRLLNLFDGKNNLNSIFDGLKNSGLKFLIYSISIDDVLEISFKFDRREEITLDGSVSNFLRLLKALYRNNLIRLVDMNPVPTHFNTPITETFDTEDNLEFTYLLEDLFKYKRDIQQADVLLLGDTPGQSTAGLLYMAAYLRRNGISAYALFNQTSWQSSLLKDQIEELLDTIKPKVVGVSMKWFIHISRVVEICKIVKNYSNTNGLDIKVVTGGNSASFFWEDIYKNKCIDYLIRGDGEVPLLQICQGKDPAEIPNCVYRKNDEVIANPITYIQKTGEGSDIYLSHMDEILLSDYSCIFGIFFIFTQKGCKKNCHYCGGCNDAQKIAFNRSGLFRRDVEEVRKDIIETMKYSSTIYFLYDEYDNDRMLEYCKQTWEGIDLSNHFGFWSNVIPPSPEIIEYGNKVFKYVYWNLDMASMSDRHRQQLLKEKMVKYQPTDTEVITMFDECEKYDNNEILINIITGLPFFYSEDVDDSIRMETYLMENYSCFGEFFWARLHAEPGAPVIKRADEFGMYSLAGSFEDFYKFSSKNFFENSIYPNVDNYDYPFIYFKDEKLNSKISRYYSDSSIRTQQYHEKMRRKLNVYNKYVTYGELDEKSGKLAALLHKMGIKPGTAIGIMTERSIEMITGLLAILKAGGHYLPIDTEFPTERIKFMLEDSNAPLLLTRTHLGERVADLKFNGEIAFMEDLHPEHETPLTEATALASDPAYIIFTSGSTGKPKGVVIQHQSILNTLWWRKNFYSFDSFDSVLQIPSYTFDSSVEDIFTPLISGSKLVLTPQQNLLNMHFLGNLLASTNVTHFLITPALYKIFLRDMYRGLKNLKFITVAGESFTQELVSEHYNKLPNVKMYNEYGPTENSVCSTVYYFDGTSATVSIGRPISNVKCYVLDKHLKLTPPGIPGELCVAGAGLAMGYLNNEDLTQEKFVDNPFAPGQRLYRTGDLVRMQADGNIEFAGRIDHQVKVRGFRIELEEISSCLTQYEDVKDAVVIVREDDKKDKQLCAYYIADTHIEVDKLREHLAKHLPYYMVPTFFVLLNEIPLTPNGKVDRRALPEPTVGANQKYNPPQNRLQEKLAGLWATELGIDKGKISIDTSFFDLGGDSLKATTLISRIHKACDVQVPLIELFKMPTITGLAELINQSEGEAYEEIEPAEPKDYYLLSPPQKRLYVSQHIQLESTTYNVPTIIVLEGQLEKERFEETFRQLISRHESLRTSFDTVNGEPVQIIAPEVRFNIEYISAPTERDEARAIKEFIRPFDLSIAPLLRAALIETAVPNKYILAVDMHHIISDAVSQLILIEDFTAIYSGVQLPSLKLQYKDFSEWKNSWPEDKIKDQETYWLSKFSGDLPQLNLPLDAPRPANRSFEGREVHFEVGQAESDALYEMARNEGTTLFTLLLAAYNVFLSKICNQNDIIVGTLATGRRHSDLHQIIGMFVNTIAIRNQPRAEKTFSMFLNEVKDNTLEAFDNQDYQFEDLVANLVGKRIPNRNPIFDTLLSMDNVKVSSTDESGDGLEGLTVSPYNYKSSTSKFDLILVAVDKGDRLGFIFRYCAALFNEETVIRFADSFQTLLTEIIKNPWLKITEIDIISESERERMFKKIREEKFHLESDKQDTAETESLDADFDL